MYRTWIILKFICSFTSVLPGKFSDGAEGDSATASFVIIHIHYLIVVISSVTGTQICGRKDQTPLIEEQNRSIFKFDVILTCIVVNTRVGTLIVVTIYLQLIQNRYMFRIFTVLHCSHQHCVQPVASDVEVVEYLQQRLLC